MWAKTQDPIVARNIQLGNLSPAPAPVACIQLNTVPLVPSTSSVLELPKAKRKKHAKKSTLQYTFCNAQKN